jgi:hypothetical protein
MTAGRARAATTILTPRARADRLDQPRRRHRRDRPERPAVRRDRRRRQLPAPEPRAPEEGLAPRKADPDRPAPRKAPPLPDPALEPLRRQARPRRDLRPRPPQPVSLLDRPRPNPDRRRGRGPPRGGRHEAPAQGEKSELRLADLRGHPALPPGPHRPRDKAGPPVPPHRRRLRDHGRRRHPRQAPARPLRPLRLRRLLHGGDPDVQAAEGPRAKGPGVAGAARERAGGVR